MRKLLCSCRLLQPRPAADVAAWPVHRVSQRSYIAAADLLLLLLLLSK